MEDPRPWLSGRSGGSPARSSLHLAQVPPDCPIILCRQRESLASKLMPQLILDFLVFVQLSNQDIILGRSGYGYDSIVEESAFRRSTDQGDASNIDIVHCSPQVRRVVLDDLDRKSTRLNSSHLVISYA